MTTINLDKLLEGFEFASFNGDFDSSAYLDLETGHIYCVEDGMEEFEEVPADIETSERYLILPNKRDLELGRDLAFEFAAETLPHEYDNVIDCSAGKVPTCASRICWFGIMPSPSGTNSKPSKKKMHCAEWRLQNAIQLEDRPQA